MLGFVCGIIGFADLVTQGDVLIRPWIIWSLAAFYFLLAILLEYHRVRLERDGLAEDPVRALNKCLSEGYELKEKLLGGKGSFSDEDEPVINVFAWTIRVRAEVRRHAPAYYAQWARKVPEDETAAHQFIVGIDELAIICRSI